MYQMDLLSKCIEGSLYIERTSEARGSWHFYMFYAERNFASAILRIFSWE